MTVRFLIGDALHRLRDLPDNSVHMCATSPPYYGKRDYGVPPSVWGGDDDCAHRWGEELLDRSKRSPGTQGGSLTGDGRYQATACRFEIKSHFCVDCGAWRGALGLEPTPELYVEHLVAVFEQVRRVLRPDGTLWLNLGDTYATGPGRVGEHPGGGAQGERWRGGPPSENSTLRGNGHVGGGPKLKTLPPVNQDSRGYRGDRLANGRADQSAVLRKKTRATRDGSHAGKHTAIAALGPMTQPNRMPLPGLKPKDLIGIPWMVAFALRRAGWWLRGENIWCLSGGTWLYARTSSGDGPTMLKDLVRLKPETVELWNGERWTKVSAWTKRAHREGAVELVLRSGERIGCTDNHVWPTARGELQTRELVAGDVLRTARLPTAARPAGWLTPEAFWFAGLYLAEGSRSGETMQLAGHIKETARWEKIQQLVVHYGGSARTYNHKGKAQNIHVDSQGLATVVRHLIAGRTAKDKRLTAAAWQYRDWALKEIATGYLEGDGHIDSTRIRLGLCRNYSLERDLRCMAARLGATLTLKPTVAKNQTGSFPAFRGEWRWERSGHLNERDRGEIVAIRRSRARQFWDVSVADHPNLFALASGVLTHNSKPNPMPESISDRCTVAHEQIFLLAKSERYFYDAKAISEPSLKFNDEGHRPRTKRDGEGFDEAKQRGFGNQCQVTETRNKRTVWTIATNPFPGAHFATFPPKLVEPYILAGTSKRGCCVECGAPWARVLRKVFEPLGETLGWWPSCRCELPRLTPHPKKPRVKDEAELASWRRACAAVDAHRGLACDAERDRRTKRAVVLDPFGGAATTALVADRLQRDSIIVELNPEYAAMAQRRLERDGGMFARAAE